MSLIGGEQGGVSVCWGKGCVWGGVVLEKCAGRGGHFLHLSDV